MKVRALGPVYYDHTLWREGAVFKIADEPRHAEDKGIYKKDDPVAFSPKAMEKVAEETPLKPARAVKTQHRKGRPGLPPTAEPDAAL